MITGLVDAFSYLVLGHVFVANMTGNVVFLGFAVAGVAGFWWSHRSWRWGPSSSARWAAASSAALGTRVDRQLAAAAGTQLLLMLAATVLCAAAGGSVGGGLREGLVAILAAALGIQNATARALAVPDLTTTVLTLTITGIAADAHAAGGSGSRAGRRLVSVGAMLAGALVGAVLILRGQVTVPLAVASCSSRRSSEAPAWCRSGPAAGRCDERPPGELRGPQSRRPLQDSKMSPSHGGLNLRACPVPRSALPWSTTSAPGAGGGSPARSGSARNAVFPSPPRTLPRARPRPPPPGSRRHPRAPRASPSGVTATGSAGASPSASSWSARWRSSPFPSSDFWGNPGCGFPGTTCTRVLFIGNSYTSVNDLPGTFTALAWAGGHRVQTDALDEGGWTLAQHLAAPETATALDGHRW